MNLAGLKYYGDGPHRIDDPEATLYEVLARRGGRCPDAKQVEKADGVVV